MKTVCAMVLFLSLNCFAQQSSGSVFGSVEAEATLSPVPGALVVLEGTDKGGITDSEGRFLIQNVSPGSYVLRVTSVGFHPRAVPDVIVRPGRITFVDLELAYSVVDGGVIHVTPDYFSLDPGEPVSRVEFSGEQIRRSPGSAGDVSRAVTALPSVTGIDDQYNGIAARGGNPSENGVYVDGMRIPNINHFPRQGTSGGGLGLINTDLVKEVKFSAGGFGPSFGNRLSSVMEIEIRQGNREEFDGQLDMSMSGFGTVLEGPLGPKGSWLFCARRSYIDLLVNIADIDALPVYSDLHCKMVYDVDPSNRFSVSFLEADDNVDYTRNQAWEDGNDNYGVTSNWNVTAGVGWRCIWPGDGFSNTVLSWNGIKYEGSYFQTLTENVQVLQNSTERVLVLRNTNTWQAGSMAELEFGIEGSWTANEFDNFYAADTNYSGEPIPELAVQSNIEKLSGALFLSSGLVPSTNLTVNTGVRIDFPGSTYPVASPRGSVELKLSPVTWVSAAAGIYRQELPGEILARDHSFENLKIPFTVHYIMGMKHLLSPETRVQFELYIKTGSEFPYDPDQPGYFILDGVSGEQDLYSFQELVSGGETRAFGAELTIQKQLINGLYGIAAGSLYSSGYRNPGEPWRRRLYDSRWTATLEGGYRFDSGWDVSGRWLFAGGRPYTPLDLEASQELNLTVLDCSRINGETYPCYSSLNLRIDRRFNFQRSSLSCYLSVWNVLNRRNVTATFWNRIENREDYIYQWATMPIFGLEYEFCPVIDAATPVPLSSSWSSHYRGVS